jgi:opacity protein-like surface antigen
MPSKHTKIAALLALSCASIFTTAHANDGFSIGVTAGNGTFSHTIERNTGSNTTPSITTRTEESDLGYGLTAGYKFNVSQDVFFGIEAFYKEENIETRNINNLLITELSLENTYGVNFKAGINVNEKFSIYALLGQTTLDFDINNSYPFAPPLRDGDDSVDETTYGIGAEFSINDHWSVTAQYTQLNDVAFTPLPEVAVPGKINDNEVDFSALTFGVNYNF